MTWDLTHIVMLLFPLIGLLCLGTGVYQIVVGLASKQWLTVEGTITRSYIESKEFARDDGSTGITHTAKVVYTFVTDGVRYEGKRLHIGEASLGNYEDVQKLLAPYPQGGRVTVYYEPGKPQNSVLKPGIYFSAWWLVGFGFFFLGMSWLILLPRF